MNAVVHTAQQLYTHHYVGADVFTMWLSTANVLLQTSQ